MEIGLAVAGNLPRRCGSGQPGRSGRDRVRLAGRARSFGLRSGRSRHLGDVANRGRDGRCAGVPPLPTVTAMTAWDLDEMSGDRFLMGLGPQVKRVMEARFSVRVEKPAPQMREYVQAVRTVWAANRGEPVVHAGEVYRITMPTFHGPLRPERRDTPILIAAVGPVMSRVCGEVATGARASARVAALPARSRSAGDCRWPEARRPAERCLPDHRHGSRLYRRRRRCGQTRRAAPDRLLRHDALLQADPGDARPRRASKGSSTSIRQSRPGSNGRVHRRRVAGRHRRRRPSG